MADKLTVHLDEEPGSFLVLKQGVEKTKAMLSTNLAGSQLTIGDLERVINPGAGATKWEIPGLSEETETVSEIKGVILGYKPYRVYWKEAYSGGGARPDCLSSDMYEGEGDPGGKCKECPYDAWGSSRTENSSGKACQERCRVFILREGELLPMIVTLSPMNSGKCRTYGLRLADRKQLDLHKVVSKLRMEQATSPGGFPYAKVIISLESVLPPEMQEQMGAYAQFLLPQLLDLDISEETSETEPF